MAGCRGSGMLTEQAIDVQGMAGTASGYAYVPCRVPTASRLLQPQRKTSTSTIPEFQAAPSKLAEPLVILPDAVVENIAVACCTTWDIWAKTWSKVSRKFDVEWYVRSCRTAAVVPSQATPTIHLGIAHAMKCDEHVVLVKPGTYRENLRLTSNVIVAGYGYSHDVILEGRGW